MMVLTNPDTSTPHRWNITLPWFRLSIFDLAVIAFIVVFGLIGMSDFELRMANLYQDDGPILFAHAFKNPSLFEGDFQVGAPVRLRTHFKVITSAVIWIPALLWRYLNIDPYFSSWIITLIQVISFGLSVYTLMLAAGQKRAVAVLAVIFAYAAGIWGWNPANYGSASNDFFTPYPAHMAMAMALFACSFLIRGHVKAVLLMLVLAGLFHPNIALYACLMVGLYWLLEGIQDQRSGTWRRLAGLVGVVIIAILPAVIVKVTMPGDSLPHAEIMAGMRQNQHIWPWGYANRWNYSWPILVKWLVLAALSWRWRSEFSVHYQKLWIAAIMGACMFSLIHVIGAVSEIPLLLNLIGIRSFIWPTLISLPLIMHYWYIHIRSGSPLGSVSSILCLTLPFYTREYGLFWPLILGLLFLDVSQGRLVIWRFSIPSWGGRSLRVTALLMLTVWSTSFLTMPFTDHKEFNVFFKLISRLTWNVFGALPNHLDRALLIGISIFLGLLSWLLGRLTRLNDAVNQTGYGNRLWSVLICFTIIVYGSGFLWISLQKVEDKYSSPIVHKLDVQLWARKNTPASSFFVVPSSKGWRTMSLRRKLYPFTRESYSYIALRQTVEYRKRLLDFYGISAQEAEELRGRQLFYRQRKQFWNFKKDDFLRFASQFNATHVVLPKYYKRKDMTQFDLPLVYQNQLYIVYSLEM